jgi:ABC-type nitrate/sulfonate/bicarbonate transport system permease component
VTARARRAARHGLGVAVLVVALVAWESWARTHPSFLFPTVTAVAERAWEVWPTAAFLDAAAASLTRLAAGFALGAALGIALGLLMGSSPRARRTLEPLTELLRATPAIAVVPAAIVVLGLGDAMRIGVIAFGVCFPVLVNTLDGAPRRPQRPCAATGRSAVDRAPKRRERHVAVLVRTTLRPPGTARGERVSRASHDAAPCAGGGS